MMMEVLMPHCTVPDVALNERACLSVGEAAALAGLSVSFLYILMERGTLRSVKVGGRRLVPREALQELLNCRPSTTGVQS
jgi:excisionase family DNA binding protein